MKPYLHVFVGVAIACAACGAEPDEAAVGADVSEQDLSGTVKGTYTVPVADPSLHSAATFPVSVKLQQQPNGDVRMHYTLPANLLGAAQSVDLVGPPGGVLTGAAGTARCTGDVDATCNERLPGMVVDMGAVSSTLDAQPLSPKEKELRLNVARQFSIDPIGVLRFQRPDGNGNGKHGGSR